MRTTRRAVVVIVFLVVLLAASVAGAAVNIYVGKGVGAARIGMNYTTAAKKLSKTYKTVRDKNYSYIVYHTYVGKKMKNKRYPIELYSKKNKKVYRFQVNSTNYKTTKGVKIGSTEKTVTSKYPSAGGPYTSGLYHRYTLKHSIYSFKTYTDFYCKNKKVAFIIVRR